MPFSRRSASNRKPIASRSLGIAGFLFTLGLHASTHAAPEPAAPIEDTLSEAQAIERALQNPALVDIFEGRLGDARADVAQAGRWPNPRVSYQREQLLGSGRAGEDYLGISQSFDLSGARWNRREGAELRVQAQGQRNEMAKAELVADVRTAYAQLLHAQLRLVVLRRWHARTDRAAAATQARASAGDLSRLDAARIRQELRILDARIAQAEGTRRRAWAELRAVMAGESENEPPRLTGPLLPASGPAPADPTLADAPQMRALGSELEAAHREQRAARRRWLPPLTLNVGYKSVDEGTGRQEGFTAGASIALPLGDRGQVQRRRAQARATSIDGQLNLTRSRLEARKSELMARHEILSAGLSEDGDEELPALAEVAYRSGELEVVGLLDAYRAVYEAQGAVLDLGLEIRIARIELDRIHGRTQP